MCVCYRNWMANDCSERVCPFGLAHVDTPKGDLDASGGALSGPGLTVVTNSLEYPYGTTEQFPAVADSRGNVLKNTAHYYQECSNKGICDRSSGSCECFPGYEGNACQRASCPTSAGGVCSGHGVCSTIAEHAHNDNYNYYKLWDKDSTMVCECDAGYYGPDCSQRTCKVGYDPLYYDDEATVRFSNWTYVIYTLGTDTTTAGKPRADCWTSAGAQVVCTPGPDGVFGNYSITFYDVTGEDWTTKPIDIQATCADVINALEGLPNNVIPVNSVRCVYDIASYTDRVDNKFAHNYATIHDDAIKIQTRFTIAFPHNPGKLKQPVLNFYLDGQRPTLYTSEKVPTLSYFIYANGFTGEETDYVSDYCAGVRVTLTSASTVNYHTLSGLTVQETKLLKKCLGDADGNLAQTGSANEVYNWDYGSRFNPHLIKLVDTTALPITTLCHSLTGDYTTSNTFGTCYVPKAPGFYSALYYDGVNFILFNPAATDYLVAPYSTGTTVTEFYVFTTTGTVQMVSDYVDGFQITPSMSDKQRIANYHSRLLYTTNTTAYGLENSAGGTVEAADRSYLGNIDCETNAAHLNATTWQSSQRSQFVPGQNYALACLNKNDQILFFNPDITLDLTIYNPRYLNIYTVEKISRENKAPGYTPGVKENERNRFQILLDIGTNHLYSLGGNSVAALNYYQDSRFSRIYKFTPPTGVTYATTCSGRGICNLKSAECECFAGHTGDDCSIQNALAA